MNPWEPARQQTQAELATERQREALAQEAAHRAEQERAAAAQRTQPPITQAERDAARARAVWDRTEEAGRQARAADRARRGPDHERPGERQGPSMGW